jgi:hypothetical protein
MKNEGAEAFRYPSVIERLAELAANWQPLRLHCRDLFQQVPFFGNDAGVIVGTGRHHHGKVECWHEEQTLPAIADRRTPGKRFTLPVDVTGPPEVAISGPSSFARRNMWPDGLLYPSCGNDLATLPATMVEHHLADPEKVARFEAQTCISHWPTP